MLAGFFILPLFRVPVTLDGALEYSGGAFEIALRTPNAI